MIARTWRGWTSPDDAERYADYIQETGLAQYSATPGNLGAFLLHRPDGDRTEFIAFTLWSDMEAIQAFAGDDIETAVFYPRDDEYLVDRETVAHHYTVTV